MTLESTTNTDWFKAAENSRIEKAVRECMEGMSLADATMMSGVGPGLAAGNSRQMRRIDDVYH